MRLHAPLRRFAALLPILALLTGCAKQAVKPFDYTAFKTARPASILVLPPLNSSPDIKASDSVMSHTSVPLAESGYYVFPEQFIGSICRIIPRLHRGTSLYSP